MTQTVPADIAAAIDALVEAADHEALMIGADCTLGQAAEQLATACDALDAAILLHLRGIDEMKAALELQTSGAA